MDTESTDPFEPPIRQEPVDPAIVAKRAQWDRDIKPVNAVWRRAAEPRFAACQSIIDNLARYHAQLVDNLDVDLGAATRWTAIFESTGRCIALADALLDQLRRGYTSETGGTARVLHEALEVAIALADGDEDQARRWLAGKQYPTKLAQKERTAFFARLMDASNRRADFDAEIAQHVADVEAETGTNVANAARAIHLIAGQTYGELSASAHNLRRGFADSISSDLRRFTYGRHPDPRIRTHWVTLGEALIEQTGLDVPAALAEIVGVAAVRATSLALIAQLQEARLRYPLLS